jgi:16S rRNA A1518/A1519 N6-dimethyltransferase RsmA/KsgA/DIM1 with predicted DNA glycosylase/AP lyase activity
MPSLRSERESVVSLLEDYPQFSSITDLGSGWGGLAEILAENFPERSIQGIESSIIPFLCSKLKNHRNVNYTFGNFLSLPLQSHQAYVCYLSPEAMIRLRKKFETDQPEQGILISIAFSMPQWTAARRLQAASRLKTAIYLYEF